MSLSLEAHNGFARVWFGILQFVVDDLFVVHIASTQAINLEMKTGSPQV